MAGNYDHIDQMIRQKFENFEPEPPLKVWENIRPQISSPSASSPGLLMPLIVILSIFIFLGGLLYHIREAGSASQIFASDLSGLYTQSPGPSLTDVKLLSYDMDTPSFDQTNHKQGNSGMTSDHPGSVALSTIPVRAPFQDNPTVHGRKNTRQAVQSPGSLNPATRTDQWKPGLRKAIETGELSYGDAAYYSLTPREVKKISGFNDYARDIQASWSIGTYLHPEITNYEDNSLENSINLGISILPQLTFNRFFIQGGVNFRMTRDKGNYAIDYNRYLGSYEDVYLVTFDSTENGVIPTYFTQAVDVYDTVDHYAISESGANYTYLEIPMMVGYHYEIGKFSLFLKAGPAASFMIASKLPPPGNPEDNARIIKADYQVPARYAVNWQIVTGAGIEYKLTDRLNFSMEPTFRFAIKPEYKIPDNSAWRSSSVGVRAGLRYNF